MKRILITGGTVFVSRFAASWFLRKGYEVFVLNRGTRPQVPGVCHLCADRRDLNGALKEYSFDAVLDVCAYDAEDIRCLLDGIKGFGRYLFISSSAVYPYGCPQPVKETQEASGNILWASYAAGKALAEQYLLSRVPDACILRPPYLYGPMQNLYREPFVFDCALLNRPFYIPGSGKMKLQFFHVEDLCRMMEAFIEGRAKDGIYNVGDPDTIDILSFVKLCYEIAGVPLQCVHVQEKADQASYFCFRDYEYMLDVKKQMSVLTHVKDFREGLFESFLWHQSHPEDVKRMPYLDFIRAHFEK